MAVTSGAPSATERRENRPARRDVDRMVEMSRDTTRTAAATGRPLLLAAAAFLLGTLAFALVAILQALA